MEKLNTYSNVNKKNYFRGVFDYRVIFFILIYVCILYQILNAFNVSILYIIYILLLSMIPVLGVYFTVSKEENVVEILINIFKYLIRTKNYIYKHNNKSTNLNRYKFKSHI